MSYYLEPLIIQVNICYPSTANVPSFFKNNTRFILIIMMAGIKI